MTADGLRFVCWFAAEGDYRGRRKYNIRSLSLSLSRSLSPSLSRLGFPLAYGLLSVCLVFAFTLLSVCFHFAFGLLLVCFWFAYCSAHQLPPDQVQHPGIDGHTSGGRRRFDLLSRHAVVSVLPNPQENLVVGFSLISGFNLLGNVPFSGFARLFASWHPVHLAFLCYLL